MGRIIVGALVAGLAMFMWSFACWMFLGVHDLDPAPLLQNEDGVIAALQGEERGMYWIPGTDDMNVDPESEKAKAWQEKHRAGPRAFLVYDPEGAEPMPPKTMVIGAVINVLTGLILALIVSGRSFLARFLIPVGVGLIFVLMQDIANWNWQNYTTSWTVGYVIDHLGAFAIAGLVLAFIVKRPSAAPAA